MPGCIEDIKAELIILNHLVAQLEIAYAELDAEREEGNVFHSIFGKPIAYEVRELRSKLRCHIKILALWGDGMGPMF